MQVQDTGEQVAVKKVKILDEITEARRCELNPSNCGSWRADSKRRVFREIKILRNLSHVNVLAISEIFAVSYFYPADLSQALFSPPSPLSDNVRPSRFADHPITSAAHRRACANFYVSTAKGVEVHPQRKRAAQRFEAQQHLGRGDDLFEVSALTFHQVNRDCDLAICDFGLARMTSMSRVYLDGEESIHSP
eukprot:747870-Hanusia_phi.AAC.3